MADPRRPPRWRLPEPEVIAERCVHSRIAQASCRACVDACPTDAWVIDEKRLGIDTERCDGCGLCAPACPEGAIEQRFSAASYRVDGTGMAFAACEKAGAEIAGTAGLIPCVHVLGVADLLRLQSQGIRRLVLCRGDCTTCARGKVRPVGEVLEQVNAWLIDRRLLPIRCDDLFPDEWSRAIQAARRRHEPPSVGRRAFFRGMVAAAEARSREIIARSDPRTPDFIPPGRLLEGTHTGQLALHAPRIAVERCTGCDACARLCPQAVIRVRPDAYRLDPDGCTGCGICRDVCTVAAVEVELLVRRPQTLVPLHQARCRACGNRYHVPGNDEKTGGICSICAESDHRRLLFQVQS